MEEKCSHRGSPAHKLSIGTSQEGCSSRIRTSALPQRPPPVPTALVPQKQTHTNLSKLWITLWTFMARDTECKEHCCYHHLYPPSCSLASLICPLHMLAQHIAMLAFLTSVPWKMSYTWTTQLGLNGLSSISTFYTFHQWDERILNSWEGVQTTAFLADVFLQQKVTIYR